MKKIITILLVIMMMVALVGCGDDPKIEQKYVDAVKYLQNTMKDPPSFRIYGDIYGVSSDSINGYALSVRYSAKNSYGGYTGAKDADIIAGNDGSFIAYFENDSDYINIRMIYENTLAGRTPNGWTVETFIIPGQDMAKVIGCEYIAP